MVGDASERPSPVKVGVVWRTHLMADEENPDFKYIVRIANTDLDGNDQVEIAIGNVKGFGVRLGAIVCDSAGVSRKGKIGDLSDEDVEKLANAADAIRDNVPTWMLNRRKDPDTGEDLHFHGSDLDQKKRDDLNRLAKIQSYRGIRHQTGQKVRGQRSRSNGRSGLAMGVQRKKD
jgi:small subunit ribosomal protein S13